MTASKKPATRRVEKLSEISAWDLIVRLCHWSYKVINLDRRQADAVYRAIWAESDGYGERGFIPAQGYDWSGIRDSSPAAVSRMAAAALVLLARMDVHVLVTETESV